MGRKGCWSWVGVGCWGQGPGSGPGLGRGARARVGERGQGQGRGWGCALCRYLREEDDVKEEEPSKAERRRLEQHPHHAVHVSCARVVHHKECEDGCGRSAHEEASPVGGRIV